MLVYLGPSDTTLKGLTLGLGVRVLMAGLSTPNIRVSSQLASRPSDGVRTDWPAQEQCRSSPEWMEITLTTRTMDRTSFS